MNRTCRLGSVKTVMAVLASVLEKEGGTGAGVFPTFLSKCTQDNVKSSFLTGTVDGMLSQQ
jgi:hypothetical protein